MRTFSQLRGQKISPSRANFSYGKIEDVYFTTDGQVKFFRISSSSFFRRDKAIPYAQSYDFISINQEKLMSLKNIDKSLLTLHSRNPLLGKKVVNRDKSPIGIILDVYFEGDLERIVGYEVSKGFFDDLIIGRLLISPTEVSSITDQYLLIH